MGWGAAGIGAGIGALFGGPVGAAIGAGIGGLIGDDDVEEIQESQEATISVIRTNVMHEGNQYPVFEIKVNGTVNVPDDNFKARIAVIIQDLTDGEEVVAIDGEAYSIYNDVIPYESSTYDNAVFQTVYIDSMNFPRKGNRKLLFTLLIIDKDDDNVEYFSSIKEVYYNNYEDGYLDIIDKRPEIENLAIKMTFIMSSIDGSIDTVEGKEIGNIGKILLEEYSDDDKYSAKMRINEYISDNYKKAKLGNLHIDTVINEINSLCDIKTKHEIFEFCLKVAAADGIADKHEVDLAYYMAEKFDLDKEEYKKQLEKILPITMQDNDLMKNTFEKTLGIEDSMSETEINAILRKEFKKWNQRVAHSDPAKRDQAELMLIEISELRNKYK